MTEQPISIKTELLADIEHNWTALNAVLDRLTETQLTTIQDAQGWTVKDHVIHMTCWERSIVYFLQRKPRHLGLGVEETLYLKGSEDAVNAAIFQQTSSLALNDALLQFRETHQQLLGLLKLQTDADLHKRYREFLPDEPVDGDGPLAINLIIGNTSGHFAEHLRWIEALVSKPA